MAGRFAAGLAALPLALAGCGGSSAPKTDGEAIASVLKDAAKAAASGDGAKACGYLTADGQRQAVLETGSGTLGDTSCPQAVGRAQLVLTPIEKKQIEALEPTNVQINGTAASATMATSAGAAPGQGISVVLNLQKQGGDWKISGFVNQQGLPGS
jgi:hypothetical protein